MVKTRKNVWELGGDWADPILWYARGVKAMQSRPLSDPTAWRFYGAIHGIDRRLWTQLGFLSSGNQLPPNDTIKTYWQQCQHGSWYFLPWHRGYVLAFEAVVRDAVVKLGGPADWAIPYWNYFKPNQNQLPPAFASPDWPDGQGDNPLFVAQRFGPNNDGNVFVPMDQVDQNALGDSQFIGASDGGSPGFGGVNTGFRQELLDGKVSLVATISDLFRSQKRQLGLDTPLLKQTVVNTRDSRITYIGLTYRFGAPPKKQKEEQMRYENGD